MGMFPNADLSAVRVRIMQISNEVGREESLKKEFLIGLASLFWIVEKV